ncbi:ankyrin repeat domain-containing protein 50-like isoform X2 [Daktulosphaira vitifoliae]|uniref:ankyrin repeat domain-containing protein 50-like isoform X2 n=1 Tax=Daktulosphaira vitifoliae TaxID=58002 RepID=UPI0021AA02E3|nr:ankyrin repeat domain-containing protein 50-like isoform X2 [Daktulosphaira vitifoliae]
MTSCDLAHKRFYCREWVFQKLLHCFDQRNTWKTCGALLVGGAGCGKTAICCEIVWPSSRQQKTLNKRLLAYHFCQAQDVNTLSVTHFIQSLVSQLSNSLPKSYKERLKNDLIIQEALLPINMVKDADDTFKKAIIFPLLELELPKHTMFLLIDSIDEGLCMNERSDLQLKSSISNTITELLASHHHLFPQWLMLICTTRRQNKNISRMFSGFRKISIDDLRKSQVVADVQQYILSRLESEESLRQHMSRDTADMLNQLHIKSNGCFLYLEKVLDGISDGCVVLREIKDIPGTLNGLYLWFCQRLLNSKHFSKVRPLLNVVLSSQKPMSEEELGSVMYSVYRSMSVEEFRKRFNLLRRIFSISRESKFIQFHHSFGEWFLDVKHCTRRFLCSANEGHAMIAIHNTISNKSPLKYEDIHILAYHLSRINPLSAWANFSDPNLLPLLWLIDSGAQISDSLTVPCYDIKSVNFLQEAHNLVSKNELKPLLHDNIDEKTLSTEEPSILVSDKISNFNEIDANGRNMLHLLAMDGNSSVLLKLLNKHSNVDLEVCDNNGQTPLNIAARQGYLDIVELLLEHKCKVDHTDFEGWTALRAAAWGGHSQVLEILLKHGANVECYDSEGRGALRAAAWGGHDDIVAKLLEAGANPNTKDGDGRTPLIAAAYMGHAHIVTRLLDNGANINHQDNDGRTALSVAALCAPTNEGYAKVVTILLDSGAFVDHEDKDGMTPLLVAAFEGHKDVCEILLESEADVDHCDKLGRTPLWAAASMGHPDCVSLLLFWGCYVDSIDNEGRTVLSVSAAQGNNIVVSQLLDRGLDEQHRDNSGWTPLHYAAFEGHQVVCKTLLESGAKIDQTDNDGKTPLMLASEEGHSLLVNEFLKVYGAPPEQKAHDGRTAIRLAALEGHIEVVRNLLEYGADVNKKDADGRSTLYVLALENHLVMAKFFINPGRADIESTDSEGRTALHVSCWQGHFEMVSLLLTFGKANLNATDNEKRTPLHLAAWQGHSNIVRLLLEQGASIDHACNQGATALGIASQEGNETCVRLLLMQGANPLIADHCGRNAIKIAAKSGHVNIVKLLEQFYPVINETNTSCESASTTETKPSSAILVNPLLTCTTTVPLCELSPVESPDSTAKRTSFVSNYSKSSSNLTGSTKSSHQDLPVQLTPLTFTQKLQQCSRGIKSRPTSKVLSPLQSPIYATPPHSPSTEEASAPNLQVLTDDHFSRDTHMRIILGNNAASKKNTSNSNNQNIKNSGSNKPKRNGIVTNPALRIMPAIRSGLELAAGRRNKTPHLPTDSFKWRKETPL